MHDKWDKKMIPFFFILLIMFCLHAKTNSPAISKLTSLIVDSAIEVHRALVYNESSMIYKIVSSHPLFSI
ncbi:MAG: hypothetical protein A3F09_01750 [Chlamydiae bacterium RIFCSPHIGHO2_12_FULL_49_11]|nr:MAG: hypothetical protein A3F09_01750 [Chlamydiae bacterium RIFCSPHIGHO2_12_FULL_49_11]